MISVDTVCDAICQLYKKYDDNIYNFIERLQKQSTKCIWMDVCRNILCNVDDRTIEKHQKKCNNIFKRHCKYIIQNVSSCVVCEQSQKPVVLGLSEDKNPCNNLSRETTFLAPFSRNLGTTEHFLLSDSSQSKESKDDLLLSVFSENEESTHIKHASSPFIDSDKHPDFKNDAPVYSPPIILPKHFWEEFWVGKGQPLRKGWADAFNIEFQKQYPLCVLAIKWHKCRDELKRGKSFFQAAGICKHATCAAFKFNITENIQSPHSDQTVHVNLSRHIHHDKERHRHHIRDKQRAAISSELEKYSPIAVKLKMLNASNKEILEAGNLNSAPSLDLLRKISSENRSKYDLDKDFVIFMLKLYDQQQIQIQGKEINGYIQEFSLLPLSIILFTEKQLRHLASDKLRHVHLDATGSIIAQPKELNSATTIYYYALIMPGNKENVGPLPIAELISAKHDVTAIQHFLDVFNYNLKKISAQKINKLETDFSLALLQSACKAFNGMNLSSYIQYMYDEYEKNMKTDVKVTALHVCSSHFIKTVSQKTKKCYPKKEQKHMRSIATSLIAKMLHCKCVSDTAEVYVVFVRLFGLKNKCTDFNELVTSVKIIVEDVSSDSTSYIPPETESGISCERKASPYYRAFKRIEISALDRCSTIPVSNPFFSTDLSEYVAEFLLPYFPLWSAVAISQYGLSRDSNAPIENYFKILKHNILDGETRIPAPRFISDNLEIIQARLKERQFPLTTSRQKRPIEKVIPDDEETAVETWKKQKKTDNKQIFKIP